MSDLQGDQLLSRRERRLREQAEIGQPEAVVEPVVPASGDEPAALGIPEISPFNPDGTPRSRRELRELREAALAQHTTGDDDLALETPHVSESEPTPVEQQQDDFDALLAETQALTLEEIEALRDGDAIVDSPPTELLSVEEAESEPNAVPPVDADSVDADSVDALVHQEDAVDSADIDEAPAAPQAYSFPDIAPLDEASSVFDDPSLRGIVRPATPETGETSDFDELISRAVAQEGAASATNTSALIMPTLPETDQIAGPLGETGELFITGSFSLPKSLVETGGHESLLDTVGEDPDALFAADQRTDVAAGMQPVSAVRAVSARGAASGLAVAEPEKEKRKLPMVLIAVGGGLVLVVAGLVVWAFASGTFA